VCDFDGVKLLWIALSLYTLFGRVLFWRLLQVWELFLFLLWVSYWCPSTFFSSNPRFDPFKSVVGGFFKEVWLDAP